MRDDTLYDRPPRRERTVLLPDSPSPDELPPGPPILARPVDRADLLDLVAVLRGQAHRVEAAAVSVWRELAGFPWRRPDDAGAAADRERRIGRINALATGSIEAAQTALRAIARAEGRLRRG